ncbi:3'-5' exonuclease [Flavobacterium flavipallidum]|uniref:3'-5' exonuclease n=1 Tax=Flavobacterium flavipallidum TaxID=3139140 RepID=A0ABU9HI27_9FLAO
MKTDKILFIDTETGGLDPLNNSLLSVAFAIWDNGKISNAKEFLINDGILNVSPKALEINRIDINKHSQVALKSEDAILEIENYLNENFHNEKIILCGHNILFDINFFKNFWTKNNRDYNKQFSHRYVDTASILFFLSVSGKIPTNTISSQNAFDYFNINVSKRHSALGDVLATAELFNHLIRISK